MQQPLTGSFELIKKLNTACILNMIRVKGSISRADIARESGLTPATVSNITAELIGLGVIAETERGESSGGRKPVLLSINKSAGYFGGIHIGSTVLEAAVANIEAEILSSSSAPIANLSPEGVVKLGSQLLEKTKMEAGIKELSGIGISAHGLVRSDLGQMVFAPNLGWSNINIGDMFAQECSLPVFVENDVRAMALAESWCGLAFGVKDYVYLFIGSGIGGAIVSGNEIYSGLGGFAGEFGHIVVEPNGPLCSCGNRGCLQAFASESAVLNSYAERRGIQPNSCSFDDIIAAAHADDKIAVEEIMRSVKYIGIELGNIVNTLSPHLIVINGWLTQLSDIVMPALKKEMSLHCMKHTAKNTKLVFSPLGNLASIKGAETCVIKKCFESPMKFFKN